MKILMIDDLPDTKEYWPLADVIAFTFEEGIKALQTKGPFGILYLDHDLGDPSPSKTGYDIMCFLEVNPTLLPGKVVITTRNPVGRQKIQAVIDKLYGRKYEE